MKFVADGPDIPDSVRQALDEDRLVIFCGAGISMPVRDGAPGLPSFAGLVRNVRDRLRATFNKDETAAFQGGNSTTVFFICSKLASAVAQFKERSQRN